MDFFQWQILEKTNSIHKKWATWSLLLCADRDLIISPYDCFIVGHAYDSFVNKEIRKGNL